MNTQTSTEPVDSENGGALPADAQNESEMENSAPEQTPPIQAPQKKLSRFRRLYRKYRAKGKWFLIGFFIFYLIRDTILYIIIPWYLAKGGISIFDWLFGN